MLLRVAIVLSFILLSMFLLYEYTTIFYLFRRWTFGLFPVFGYYDYNNYENSCPNLFCGHTSTFLYQIPGSEITGS